MKKQYVLLWKHETHFKNAVGEEYCEGECHDCGSFCSEEEAIDFARDHLPKNANYKVFHISELLEDVEEFVERKTEIDELTETPEVNANGIDFTGRKIRVRLTKKHNILDVIHISFKCEDLHVEVPETSEKYPALLELCVFRCVAPSRDCGRHAENAIIALLGMEV